MPKRIFTLRLVFILMLSISSLLAIELDWLHDYDRALLQAKQEKKDVYLFIGADKCRFCTRFKNITLSNQDVIKRLEEDYVLLYLSRDQHKIPSHLKTKGVPLHYFIHSEGKIFHEAWGAREPIDFYTVLDEAELNNEFYDK